MNYIGHEIGGMYGVFAIGSGGFILLCLYDFNGNHYLRKKGSNDIMIIHYIYGTTS